MCHLTLSVLSDDCCSLKRKKVKPRLSLHGPGITCRNNLWVWFETARPAPSTCLSPLLDQAAGLEEVTTLIQGPRSPEMAGPKGPRPCTHCAGKVGGDPGPEVGGRRDSWDCLVHQVSPIWSRRSIDAKRQG